MSIDPVYMREIIMDNYQYPHNKKLSEDPSYRSVHMASDSCIDDITVQAKFRDGKIDDMRFDGEACTISTASTSILTELVKGKTLDEAKEIIRNYFRMIDQKDYDEDMLEEAVAFCTVGNQANRINCATIGWRGLSELIRQEEAGADAAVKESITLQPDEKLKEE